MECLRTFAYFYSLYSSALIATEHHDAFVLRISFIPLSNARRSAHIIIHSPLSTLHCICINTGCLLQHPHSLSYHMAVWVFGDYRDQFVGLEGEFGCVWYDMV